MLDCLANVLRLPRLAPFLVAAAVTLASVHGARAGEGDDRPAWGPLFQAFETPLASGSGWEALGPLLGRTTRDGEEVADEGERMFRVSPLFATVEQAELERFEWEFLYPAVAYDRFGTERRFHFLQLFSVAAGRDQDDSERRRTTLFPLYFRQVSPGGSNDYLAVLPFYGEVRNRLFRERVSFVLAPLYVHSEKRGVETDNYLMPFFHRRTGAGVDGWQFWPVVGHEVKVPGLRTNLVDEAVVVPGHDKWFALWPFFFTERLGLGTTNEVSNLFLPPWHLRTRSPGMDHTWWFFFSRRTNRVDQYSEWSAPWPFVGGADGPGKQARRFWPLHGWATTDRIQSRFFLWPLWIEKRQIDTDLDRRRSRALFFLWNDVELRSRTDGRSFRRRDLWPLWTHRRDLDGRERVQALALLEPVFPGNRSIERLYGPMWALYRHEADPGTGRSSRSVLWNLWRRDVTPERARTSFLFGMVRVERTENGRRWGIFRWPRGRSGEGGDR